jgi:hypothetical protein
MSDEQGGPSVPADRLDDGGWALEDETTETLFRLPAARVRGHTLLYEDDDLRAAVAAATDGALDRMWRFFFATSITFEPPLPPGVGTAMISATVRREAKKQFADTLASRGFREVSTARSEQLRIDGNRARLTAYDATLDVPVDGTERALPVTGWLGVWAHDGFRVAGGAYPATPLGAFLDVSGVPDGGPREFQNDLLALIRGVR